MSNPFVTRVANWLAQEVVVKGLSESKAFQRFALRTDHKLGEMKKRAAQTVDVNEATGAASGVAQAATGFARSIRATVEREMTATPKPREIAFKSKQDLIREAREAAAAAGK